MSARTLLIVIALTLFSLSCSSGGEEQQQQEAYTVPPEVEQIPYGPTFGLRAPEIVLPGPHGEEIALSSYRGKLVLLDFWASWCPPCRQENPHLVKLYKDYRDASFEKGEGFAIYQVSLDRDREAWLKAIEDDGLIWSGHVSDLEGARSEVAQAYEVTAIPTSFLLDRNGVIIGKNLRGDELDDTLEGLLAE